MLLFLESVFQTLCHDIIQFITAYLLISKVTLVLLKSLL